MFKIKKQETNYPISENNAIDIANKYLKHDFVAHSDRKGISYIHFDEYKIKEKQHKYYLVQVTKGKISQMTYNEETEVTFNSDGFFTKEELKKLRCLVDVNTGEYQYYPK